MADEHKINISSPKIAWALPTTEQRRVLTMALVTQDGYPKLELRRWKLGIDEEKKRLDGVMIRNDESAKFFETLKKLAETTKDKTATINDTLTLFWKGSDSIPSLKITRTYAGDVFKPKTFNLLKDAVGEILVHVDDAKEIFDLMIRRYELSLNSGTVNPDGVVNVADVQAVKDKLIREIQQCNGKDDESINYCSTQKRSLTGKYSISEKDSESDSFVEPLVVDKEPKKQPYKKANNANSGKSTRGRGGGGAGNRGQARSNTNKAAQESKVSSQEL